MMNLVNASFLTTLLLFISSSAFSIKTVYSQIDIPLQCEEAYQSGSTDLQKTIQSGKSIANKDWFIPFMDQNTNKYGEECSFFYSVGFFENLSLLQQMLTMELALEVDEAMDDQKSSRYFKDLLSIYDARFAQVGLTSEITTKILNDSNFRNQSLTKLENELNTISTERDEAIPFGRFVFVGLQGARFSIYEYKQRSNGAIAKDQNLQVILTTGSYQKTAESLFKRSTEILKDYLNWNPSLFFGEDSLWRGSWVSFFQKNPPKTVREAKQEGYENSLRKLRKFARGIKLDTTPFLKLETIMLKREKATLQRDLSAFDAMAEHWYTPLLVPVGMYAGSALLIKTGWFTATTAATGSYVGGSLALGANASAALSLGAITGLTAHGAYTGYKEAQKSPNGFNFAKVLDYAAVSAMQSFSLAATLPVITGATLLGGQHLFSGTRALLSKSISTGRAIKALGVRGSLESMKSFVVQLPGRAVTLPQIAFKAWLKAWYKNPKFLLTSYGVDIALTVIFDCGYRQLTQAGDKKCVFEIDGQNKINKQFLYSLGSTVVIGAASKPMIFIKSATNRFIAYRALDLFASELTQLVISHETDPRRLVFDQFFGTTFGTAFGEANRALVLSQYVQNQSAAKQAVLIFAIKAILMSPAKSAIRVYLADEYVADEKNASEIVRKLLWSEAKISIEGFDDEEIIDALSELRIELQDKQLLVSI